MSALSPAIAIDPHAAAARGAAAHRVPVLNARLLRAPIPNSELRLFDCGHLFALTRADEPVRVMDEFLDRP